MIRIKSLSKLRHSVKIPVILAFFLWFTMVYFLFYSAMSADSSKTALALSSQVQQLMLLRDTYALNRSLADLEQLGSIRCPVLTSITDEGASRLVDLSYRGGCSPFQFFLQGQRRDVKIKMDDHSQVLLLSFSIFVGFEFYVAFFSVFSFGGLSIGFLIYRRKVEEKLLLERYQADIEHADQFRQSAQQLAHDIRSPLSALSILATKMTESTEGYSRMLVNVSQRIHGIADDYLVRSKQGFTKNVGSFEFQVINVLGLTKSTVAEKRIESSKATFKISSDSSEVLNAIGITSYFQRVLSNILNNAIEASPDGSEILVVLVTSEKSIEVVIQDRGPGFSNQLLKVLGHSVITTKGQSGYGIGILYSARILRSWGGDINFENHPTGGGQVTIKLKRAQKMA